jgi:hypothetical protein
MFDETASAQRSKRFFAVETNARTLRRFWSRVYEGALDWPGWGWAWAWWRVVHSGIPSFG